LSDAPYHSGDFIWCAFPARENPAHPGPRHIGYVAISTSTKDLGSAAFVSYTTSQPWTGGRKPAGVHEFGREAAAAMGQSRPFTLDLRRMAAVPITTEWFPDLNTPHRGIVGRAHERLRVELEAAAKDLFRRRPEIIERLGPLWPGGRR
jgi:hypothetical protein